MIKTKFGYMTREEAKICGDLERWLKQKKQAERRPNGRRFSVPKTRVWRAKDVQDKDSSRH
ncbi:hypothetical protein OKN36_20410 [Furfurilactobacillus sp. OKN36]